MIKAILFDMDGTLVDTENLDNDVASAVSKNLGFELTKEEQEERHGRTNKSFYEYLAVGHPGFNVPKAIEDQLAGFEAELKKGPKPFAGAKELPKMLAGAGYKLAIVSGSNKSQIDIVLQSLGIAAFFNTVVAVGDYAESKPSPEGYLLAAKRLGVLPEECVVLEDGNKGVQAGKSAGMKVIGVVNNGGQDLSQADIVVSNLSEITLETLTFN